MASILFAGDVMDDGSISVLAFEWPSDDRPRDLRNRGSVDDRADRRIPGQALRIDVSEGLDQFHLAAIVQPLSDDVSDELAVVRAPRERSRAAS